MKNIFYTSNANKELFTDNTRSDFNSYIDINDLNYIHYDVEVAIKSIAFDDTQSIFIQPNIKQPHFIIVQGVHRKDVYPKFSHHQPPKIVILKVKIKYNSASADGGPRSCVRAHGTLCSAPHRH